MGNMMQTNSYTLAFQAGSFTFSDLSGGGNCIVWAIETIPCLFGNDACDWRCLPLGQSANHTEAEFFGRQKSSQIHNDGHNSRIS